MTMYYISPSISLCACSPLPTSSFQVLMTGCPFLLCGIIILKPPFVIKWKRGLCEGKIHNVHFLMCQLVLSEMQEEHAWTVTQGQNIAQNVKRLIFFLFAIYLGRGLMIWFLTV